MKRKIILLSAFYLAMVTTSCNNSAHSKALEEANAIQETIQTNSPGSIATSDDGNYIKAKIDGRQWSAAYVRPDYDERSSYFRIAGDNDGDGLSFTLWKQGIRIGKSNPFSENHAVDLTLNDVPGFMSGLTGEAVVTAFDDQWIEGTFHFTATGSTTDKKVQVTDGQFRISRVANVK